MLILWRLQLVWRQYGKKRQIYRPIIDRIGLAHVQLRPWVFKAATATKIYCKLVRSWGIVSILKSLQKQLQGRQKTTVSENRYTSLKIGVFWTAILTLIATRETMRGHHLWYTRCRIPLLQSCGIAECLHGFPSAFERPSIPVVQWLLTYSKYGEIASNIQKYEQTHSFGSWCQSYRGMP